MIYGSINNDLQKLYLIVTSLLVFGLVTLFSISSDPFSFNSSFSRQIIFILFSFFIFFLLKAVDIKAIHDNSITIYLISIFVCFIPFFMPPVENTSRWIDLGLFYIQPAEYLKCATVIAIAKYLSNNQLAVKDMSTVIVPVLIASLSAFIVLNQPDLGTSVIILVPVLPMLLWAGVNNFTIFLMIIPFITIIAASNNLAFNIWAFLMFVMFMLFQGKLLNRILLYFANIFAGLLFPFFLE